MAVLRVHWRQETEDGSPIRLDELLKAMGSPGNILAGTHPLCPDCGREVDLQQHLTWKEAPMALVVQLARTCIGPGGIYRDDALVEVPRLGREACGAVYDLVAQILRNGPAAAGHFAARVLRQGLWWVCDDLKVRSCPKLRVEAADGDCCGLVFAKR
jgi:ubiquitin C-terminal hydrolase